VVVAASKRVFYSLVFVRDFLLDEFLERETDELVRSWEDYDRQFLANYLVQDVQDPRINLQSILTRHFILRELFDDDASFLIDHEIRFSLFANWVMGIVKSGIHQPELKSILESLREQKPNQYGYIIPWYVSEIFRMLATSNYICDILLSPLAEDGEHFADDKLFSTFENVWTEELAVHDAKRISVIEPACGSANDWRFFVRFGISRFINYTGFDLCENNIVNSKSMFPDADFRVGNVLEIDCEDDAYDYCYVHDLFEHLSIPAMETAIAEVCRITKKKLCVHFFNMSESTDHEIKKVASYHYNLLSCKRVKELFLKHATKVKSVCIDKMLEDKYDFPDMHNKDAYTFYVTI